LCTVFGESEVISLLSQGRPVEDIIAGIHKSIAKRVVAMTKKVGIKEAVFFDGGPAFNQGLKKAREQELGVGLYMFHQTRSSQLRWARLLSLMNIP
ncbi:MAG TPA: BadF/BadG/BcrA/BcrD ATPase family protein, partial [Candidatus Brocadiaceae bacterium]